MLANTRSSYGLIAQLLHWITAGLILVLISLGLFMHELPMGSATEAAHKAWYYSLHKTLGVVAFAVAVVRVAWALVQTRPQPLNGNRVLETVAARTVHWLLYGAIIVMPLTGWLHHAAAEGFAPIWWPLSQDLPFIPKNPSLAALFGVAHYSTAALLGLSIALHIAGALKHVVIDRDGTFARMVPGRTPAAPARYHDPGFRHLPTLIGIMALLVLAGATVTQYLIKQPGATPPQAIIEPQGAAANGWLADHQKSRLAIGIIQSGSEISGHFENWSAVINFDPEKLKASRVEVRIDVASLSLGGVSEQAISPEFLNAAMYPVATFVAEEFVGTGEGGFEARGQLTLAGQTGSLILPFKLKIVDGRAMVKGSATIKRLDFGVGGKGFQDDGMVGFEVVIKVALEAEKAPSW
jgi:cytochrome b561/polyisoprenoid-binding protein YceI